MIASKGVNGISLNYAVWTNELEQSPPLTGRLSGQKHIFSLQVQGARTTAHIIGAWWWEKQLRYGSQSVIEWANALAVRSCPSLVGPDTATLMHMHIPNIR